MPDNKKGARIVTCALILTPLAELLAGVDVSSRQLLLGGILLRLFLALGCLGRCRAPRKGKDSGRQGDCSQF